MPDQLVALMHRLGVWLPPINTKEEEAEELQVPESLARSVLFVVAASRASAGVFPKELTGHRAAAARSALCGFPRLFRRLV